jgi:predicted Zn-dependent peptidase
MQLDNGAKILCIPMKNVETACLYISTQTGSVNDTVDGISHLLEHMVFNGTKKLANSSLINNAFDSLPCHSNAFTSFEQTTYYGRVYTEQLNKCIDLLSDLFLNSTLPVSSFKKEKSIVTEEIKTTEEDPDHIVMSNIFKLLYPTQRLGKPVGGTIESVNSISLNMLKKFKQENYVSNDLIVVLAGKYKNSDVDRLIKIFSKLKPSNKQVINGNNEINKVKYSFEKRNENMCYLNLGFHAYPRWNKKFYAFDVLSTILCGNSSSRLFKQIRDKMGLCYSVYDSINLFRNNSSYIISSIVDNKNKEKTISEILKEIKNLKNISKKELEMTKRYIIGSTNLSLESVYGYADFYNNLMINNKGILLNPKEVFNEYNKVSLKDMQEIVSEIFSEENTYLTVLGRK